jgi:hypothetical protein
MRRNCRLVFQRTSRSLKTHIYENLLSFLYKVKNFLLVVVIVVIVVFLNYFFSSSSFSPFLVLKVLQMIDDHMISLIYIWFLFLGQCLVKV